MPDPTKAAFNPWPASIIAVFAVAITCAVGVVIFCTRQKVELVAADYYEQEVRYQSQLDRAQRAASLQAPATIRYDTMTRRITVSLPADHRKPSLKGWIQLYRPSAANQDQKLPLQVNGDGEQIIEANGLSVGLWHVRISWNLEGADYFFDQKLVIAPKPT